MSRRCLRVSCPLFLRWLCANVMIRASTGPTKFIKHEGEAENAAGLRNFQEHMKLRHPGGKQSNKKGRTWSNTAV